MSEQGARWEARVRVAYDRDYDAVMIYLVPIGPGVSKYTYRCDEEKVDGYVNLDLDENMRLQGIEVLLASEKLPGDSSMTRKSSGREGDSGRRSRYASSRSCSTKALDELGHLVTGSRYARRWPHSQTPPHG